MAKSREVEEWLSKYDNPMKSVVQRVRDIVLAADPRVEECIKWQAPTFTFQGNIASFFPKSKKHASLMFHTGAQIPGNHPLFQGSGQTSQVVKLASVAEADAARGGLTAIVRAWCDWKAAGPPVKAAKKKATKKRATKKKATKKKATKKKAAKKKATKKKAAKKK